MTCWDWSALIEVPGANLETVLGAVVVRDGPGLEVGRVVARVAAVVRAGAGRVVAVDLAEGRAGEADREAVEVEGVGRAGEAEGRDDVAGARGVAEVLAREVGVGEELVRDGLGVGELAASVAEVAAGAGVASTAAVEPPCWPHPVAETVSTPTVTALNHVRGDMALLGAGGRARNEGGAAA